VITADALTTQKAVEKGADWLLPLKGNHPLVEEKVGSFMGAHAGEPRPALTAGVRRRMINYYRLECKTARSGSWLVRRRA